MALRGSSSLPSKIIVIEIKPDFLLLLEGTVAKAFCACPRFAWEGAFAATSGVHTVQSKPSFPRKRESRNGHFEETLLDSRLRGNDEIMGLQPYGLQGVSCDLKPL